VKLIIPLHIQDQIGDVVSESELETGVVLFGERTGEDFTVLGIAGPGPNATHELAHYSGNEDYATMVFEDLLKGNPNLKHIGELHVHPFRMRNLSRGDRATVKELLNEYEEFIAGVMLPGWWLRYYPVFFSRQYPEGQNMEVKLEGQTNRGGWFGYRRKRRR